MSATASLPPPAIDTASAPYWQALAEGRLSFQRCAACRHAWLPPREACPHCLAPDPGWETASGAARLISWVVYHRAYHDAMRDRLPWTVAVVELDAGPRLISNIVGVADPEALVIDQPLTLRIEMEGATAVPRFAPALPR